jgi:hypothetical protein
VLSFFFFFQFCNVAQVWSIRGLKQTSGYPRLCHLVSAGSTSGLYPTRLLLHRLSLATRPVGSTGGLYPGRPLLRRPIPGPHAPLTPVVHQSPAASLASPFPHPHVGPGRAEPCGNTKPGVTHFETLFLLATSIGRNPKPPSQTDGQCDSFRNLVSINFFCWVVIWGVAESAS